MKRTFLSALGAALLGLAGAPAFAQSLNFDAVCATPPCAIGTLYAAAGVTFTPANAQIVASGTNGLTGNSGGRYLAVSAFPYDVTINLARPSTYVQLSFSRASTSSGPITMTVTGLRSGAVVDTANRTLTNVDEWTSLPLSSGGGIDQIVIDTSGGANLSFGLDNVQLAGTCFGFTDVLPADSFCNSAEWLANRGVTLGCTANQYCPGDNVTRAQMALFMNRLGNALTPEIDYVFDNGTNNFSTPLRVLCETADRYPTTRERVLAMAEFQFSPQIGTWTARMQLVYSTDGGATWTTFDPVANLATAVAGQHQTLALTAPQNLTPGNRYRFAMEVSRHEGSGNLLSGGCRLSLLFVNRTGTGPPFDVR